MKTYAAPKLSRRIADQVEQGLFDFLVPYKKPQLKPFEVAQCLNLKEDSVYDLITLGQLESVGHNIKGIGIRRIYSVTRRSVLLYLAANSNFDPTDLHPRLRTLLESLDAPALEYVAQATNELRARLH